MSKRSTMKRKITLQLPTEFVELCERDLTTPEDVLRGFIGDLSGFISWRLDGFHSNGLDARRCAQTYYEQVGYARNAEHTRKSQDQ